MNNLENMKMLSKHIFQDAWMVNGNVFFHELGDAKDRLDLKTEVARIESNVINLKKELNEYLEKENE